MSENIISALIGAFSGGVLGFISNMVMTFANRKKNAAEAEKNEEEAKQAGLKTQKDQQDQISALVLQVDGLIKRGSEKDLAYEKERDEKRKEINRIYENLRAVQGELQTVQTLNSSLVTQIDDMRRHNARVLEEARAAAYEKDRRIQDLEEQVKTHTQTIRRMADELLAVKKKTGQLTARNQA